MIKVVTGMQMRNIDEVAIKEHKIPSLTLMENAGKSLFYFLKEEIKDLRKKKIILVCGTGNNAGDALVAARYLSNYRIKIEICIISQNGTSGSGDFIINLKRVPKTVKIFYLDSLRKVSSFQKMLDSSDILIDGIFGTGLKKNISGIHFEVINAMNNISKIKVAIDTPSGLDVDTGAIKKICFKADYTVAFGLPKFGFFVGEGPDYTGRIIIKDIGFPPGIIDKIESNIFLLEEADIAKVLPERNISAHKGLSGKLLIIGASTGMTGAAALTALSALRSGAGLVYLAIPESLNQIMEEKVTEAITVPLKESKGGSLSVKSFASIKKISKAIDVIVLGPGMGRSRSARLLVRRILQDIDKPMVVDADALFALSKIKVKIKSRQLILTPHPLEFSRLVGKNIKDVLGEPVGFLRSFAHNLYAYIVFKKAFSLIVTPRGIVYINPTGNPSLASAGTGDVLCGMIGGFLAQTGNLRDAVVLGVYLHGKSADEYVKDKDYLSLVASDLLENIPFVLKDIRNKKTKTRALHNAIFC